MSNDKNEKTEKSRTAETEVPYIVHEGIVARMERQIKRLWIALIIAVLVIAGTNFAWLYYESQFETISYSQDGEGLNNINTGTQGDLYGTESKSETP